jgi:ATP-dependent Clp protease adaptor protein ClpS
MGGMGYIKDQRTVVVTLAGKVKSPPAFYRISILNSKDSSLDFYAALLQSVFHQEFDQSYSMAMKIKVSGMAELGNFTKDIAETKIAIARNYAKKLHLEFECILVKLGDYAVKKS